MAISASTATVCERFQETARRFAADVALCSAEGERWTWGEYAHRVEETARGLAAIGVGRGDVIACWLSDRPELRVADAAAMHLGAVPFAIHDSATVEQATRLVADAGARVLITDREPVRTAVEHLVLVEGDAPEGLGWDELLAFADPDFAFESAWQAVRPDDLAALVHTAGTAGAPKEVELTHRNVAAQALALTDRLRLRERARTVSVLPLALVIERLWSHYLPMFGGWEVVCRAGRPEATLGAARPTVLLAPPHVWEQLRGIALEALDTGVAATAACSDELLGFWRESGVPVAELYGLSESTGALTVDGRPLDACEVLVSEDGEVLARGPVVSPAAIDADGWLHTGDAGAFDSEGRLRIAEPWPAGVEAAIRAETLLIGQVCVIGDGRPYNVALLTLDPQATAAFGARAGVATARPAEHRLFVEAVRAEVAAANARLAEGDRVARFLLLEDVWPPGGDELTPSLRLRRERVARKYAIQIDALYAGAVGMQI